MALGDRKCARIEKIEEALSLPFRALWCSGIENACGQEKQRGRFPPLRILWRSEIESVHEQKK